MAVNTTNIVSGPYPGNDVADTFNYGFTVITKDQLTVFETDADGVETTLTVDTDYTVSGVGTEGGDTVTRVAGALPTDYTWYIRSNYLPTQLTSFTSQGAFYPQLHEKAMDKLTFLMQQVLDQLDRSMKISDSYTGDLPLTMENPDALKLLRWKSDLSGFENVDITDLEGGTYTVGTDPGDIPTNAIVADTTVSVTQDDYDRSPLFVDGTDFTAGAGPHVITAPAGWTPSASDTRFYKLDTTGAGTVTTVVPSATTTSTYTVDDTLLTTDVLFIGDDTFRNQMDGDPADINNRLGTDDLSSVASAGLEAAARTNLEVYSETETDAFYCSQDQDLADLDDVNNAKVNLAIGSRVSNVYNNATGSSSINTSVLDGEGFYVFEYGSSTSVARANRGSFLLYYNPDVSTSNVTVLANNSTNFSLTATIANQTATIALTVVVSGSPSGPYYINRIDKIQ